MVRIPTRRPPMHPGRMLERILEDLDVTQSALAEMAEMPFQRVNQIVRRRRAVTPDTALRLSRLLGTTPQFWLNLQLAWDLYHAQQEASTALKRIKPLPQAKVA